MVSWRPRDPLSSVLFLPIFVCHPVAKCKQSMLGRVSYCETWLSEVVSGRAPTSLINLISVCGSCSPLPQSFLFQTFEFTQYKISCSTYFEGSLRWHEIKFRACKLVRWSRKSLANWLSAGPASYDQRQKSYCRLKHIKLHILTFSVSHLYIF